MMPSSTKAAMGSTTLAEKCRRFFQTMPAFSSRDMGASPGVITLLGRARDSSGVEISASPKPATPLMTEAAQMLTK